MLSPVPGLTLAAPAPRTPHPRRAGKDAELLKLGWSLSTCISDPFPGDAAAAAAAPWSTSGEPLAPHRPSHSESVLGVQFGAPGTLRPPISLLRVLLNLPTQSREFSTLGAGRIEQNSSRVKPEPSVSYRSVVVLSVTGDRSLAIGRPPSARGTGGCFEHVPVGPPSPSPSEPVPGS